MRSADQILASPHRELFPGGHDEIRAEFRRLAREWHPDICREPRAGEVFAHLCAMRDKALYASAPPQASFRMTEKAGGKLFRFPYFERRAFEAGEIFVTQSTVVYHVKPEYADLSERASRVRFTFRDKKMADSLAPLVPNLVRDIQVEEGRLMIYRRSEDQVLLVDLLEKMGAEYVSGPHGMWILSGLLNLASYMWITDRTHFAMLPHYILVSPPLHSVALTGPPLYLREDGERPDALPPEVLSLLPGVKARGDVSGVNLRADGTVIRHVVRTMMGIRDIATLRSRSDLHEGFREFLATVPERNALEDYRLWERLRGKTKFTPMEVDAAKLYARE